MEPCEVSDLTEIGRLFKAGKRLRTEYTILFAETTSYRKRTQHMKYYKPILLTMPLLFFWILPAFSAVNSQVVLKSVAFQQHEGKGEAIQFVLTGENTPKIFMISGENPRLVIDFYETRCSNHVHPSMDTGGKIIRRIRVGIHTEKPPKTRVVVDLIPGRDYHFKQNFNQKDNTLLVSVSRTEKEGASTQNKTAGEEKKQTPAPNTEPVAQKKHTGSPKSVVLKPEKEQRTEKQHATNKLVAQEKTKLHAKKEIPLTEAKAPEKMSAAGKVHEAGSAQTSKPEMKKEKTTASTGAESKTLEKTITSAIESQNNKPGAPGESKMTRPKQEIAEAEGKSAETASSAKKSKPLLSNVTFEATSDKGEMILFKLNDFFPPKVFGIEKGAPKVICDFLDTQLGEKVKSLIHCNGKFVKSIQISKLAKPEKVRVTLTLVPSRNYDLQQVFFKEDNLFVIIVNSQDVLPKNPDEPKTNTVQGRS